MYRHVVVIHVDVAFTATNDVFASVLNADIASNGCARWPAFGSAVYNGRNVTNGCSLQN